MFTLMRDPVTLQSSKVNIDRSTIKSHLLSDSKDPFNRVPLTLEEVIPSAFSPTCLSDCLVRLILIMAPVLLDTELKERIEAFLAERRNKGSDPGPGPGTSTEKDVEMDASG